jgi:hypothetical protein
VEFAAYPQPFFAQAEDGPIRLLLGPTLSLAGSSLRRRLPTAAHPNRSLLFLCSPLPYVLPPATPVESIGACVARFPIGGGLPRYYGGSASTLEHFEAYPVFTLVAACTAR